MKFDGDLNESGASGANGLGYSATRQLRQKSLLDDSPGGEPLMTKDDLEGLRHSVNQIKHNFYLTDTESSNSEKIQRQIEDKTASPRLPDTFVGETGGNHKKRKSTKLYQPKVDHVIESSDGSNNLQHYDKIY